MIFKPAQAWQNQVPAISAARASADFPAMAFRQERQTSGRSAMVVVEAE